MLYSTRNRKTFLVEYQILGVLHGGLEPCDNSDFPALYVRITTPYIWNWLNDFANQPESEIESNVVIKQGKINFSKTSIRFCCDILFVTEEISQDHAQLQC